MAVTKIINVWYSDGQRKHEILGVAIIQEEARSLLKKRFCVTTVAESTSTAFEATDFMSKDQFKNFKKHFNLHNVKLIGQDASAEYLTEKVFPTKRENTKR